MGTKTCAFYINHKPEMKVNRNDATTTKTEESQNKTDNTRQLFFEVLDYVTFQSNWRVSAVKHKSKKKLQVYSLDYIF